MTGTRTMLWHAAFSLVLAVVWQTAPSRALANEPKDLVGTWKSEMQDPRTGGWRTLCWYTVGLRGNNLVMGFVDFSIVDPDVGPPSAITNIKVSRDRWWFTSHVDGRAFQFDLRKLSPIHYEGSYSINGQPQAPRRRLVKIADRRQFRNELDSVLARLEVARETTERLIAMSRQNQQYWRDQAAQVQGRFVQPDGTVVIRPSVGSGALESIFSIKATGRAGAYAIRLQEILDRTQAARAARDRLRG